MDLLKSLAPFDGNCRYSNKGDVSLIFSDGTVLKAHGFILSLSSDVFKIWNSLENYGILDLGNANPNIWKIILNMLYPSSVDYKLFTWVVFEDLVREADKYNMQCIIDMCDNSLNERPKLKTKNAKLLFKQNSIVWKEKKFDRQIIDLCNCILFAERYSLSKFVARCCKALEYLVEALTKEKKEYKNFISQMDGKCFRHLFQSVKNETIKSFLEEIFREPRTKLLFSDRKPY